MRYHNDPSYEGSRVVGFDVEPVSVAQAADVDPATCVNDGVTGIAPNKLPRAVIREPADVLV